MTLGTSSGPVRIVSGQDKPEVQKFSIANLLAPKGTCTFSLEQSILGPCANISAISCMAIEFRMWISTRIPSVSPMTIGEGPGIDKGYCSSSTSFAPASRWLERIQDMHSKPSHVETTSIPQRSHTSIREAAPPRTFP